MKKITWEELETLLRENPNREGVVVFKQMPSWKKEYSEKARSYRLNGHGYHFQKGKISNSIYGVCLDENDPDSNGIRLDWVIWASPEDRWEIDYCYMLK